MSEKSDFVLNAYIVNPTVAPRVATAALRTLSGVYKEQIIETMYDSANVKRESRSTFHGDFVDIPPTQMRTMSEISDTAKATQNTAIF